MTTLDRIVRSVLLQKGFPLHYYLRYLKYGSDCIRELSYDTVPCITPVTLQLNSYFAVDVPCNFQDIVRIGVRQGQFLHPIAQRNTATNTLNYNSSGQPIPWTTLNPANQYNDFAYYPGYWMYNNIDDLGESVGRAFGLNSGDTNLWYKYIPERRQIQFSEQFPCNEIVLEYINDGECINNATMVDSYSIATIEAYIDWKYKLHQRRQNLQETEIAKRNFGMEWRKLRARKNELDIVQIRQILQRSYNGAPKNV